MSVTRIVVASPGDVQEERLAVERVASELNSTIGLDLSLTLRVSRWETDSYPGLHEHGPQGLIDEVLRIPDCDIFVGIFWKRFGTPVHDAPSGTAHEFGQAFDAWRIHRSPTILLYFNRQPFFPKSLEEHKQAGLVLQFKENLPKEVFWWPYDGHQEFESLLRQHITRYLLRDRSAPRHLNISREVNPQGRIAPKLLDRGVQSDQFRLAFVKLSEAKPTFPQIYILPGRIEEDHAGLIERFKELIVKPYHERKAGAISEPKTYRIRWVEPSLSSRLQPLLSRTFSTLGAEGPGLRQDTSVSDLRPATFISLIESVRTPLVIRHDICDEHWCRWTGPLIKDYWDYWTEVGKLGAGIPILIFLNFVYMSSDSAVQHVGKSECRKSLSSLLRSVRKAEKANVPHSSVTVLDELSCIHSADVLSWLEDLGLYSLHERLLRAESLFPVGQPCRDLASLEHDLDQLRSQPRGGHS